MNNKQKIIEQQLESTGYRRLFECIKEEGISQVSKLIETMRELEQKNLVSMAVLDGYNETLSLIKQNKWVVKYLRENKEEIRLINLTSDDVLKVLQEINENPRITDTYMENAKILEELKIKRIKLVNQSLLLDESFNCEIYRDSNGQITNIDKYYTDGIIVPSEEILIDEARNISKISLDIFPYYRDQSPTYLLKAVNNFLTQYREIMLSSFDFNKEYLPTEEELSSYEIPVKLRK